MPEKDLTIKIPEPAAEGTCPVQCLLVAHSDETGWFCREHLEEPASRRGPFLMEFKPGPKCPQYQTPEGEKKS